MAKISFAREVYIQTKTRNMTMSIMSDKTKKHPMAEVTAIRRMMLKQNKLLYDFGIGEPSEPTPQTITDALHESVTNNNHYPRTKGNKRLRAAAAEYLQKRYSIDVNPCSQVAITSGNKESIFHLPMSLDKTNTEKKYIVYGVPGRE
jgi:aspartate/methionine/tyrosine aminotransferase